ncbi:hypothetical protein GMJAKD_11425 [Candidatus Electrothrix aarhusensis]
MVLKRWIDEERCFVKKTNRAVKEKVVDEKREFCCIHRRKRYNRLDTFEEVWKNWIGYEKVVKNIIKLLRR